MAQSVNDPRDCPQRVTVVLLTMNQLELTKRCLESLHAISHEALSIVLWDNGSNDGTAESVRGDFPSVLVHEEPQNVGVASGRNGGSKLAIEAFDPDFLFFLDNDMVVEPDCVDHLLKPFATSKKICQTTGKIMQLRTGNTIYGAGGCRIRFWKGDTTHRGYGQEDRGQFDRSMECVASGGCMLVRRDVFEELGGFDRVFDPYGPEDLDFGLRARASGYRGYYVPEAVVYHEPKPGRTFEGGQYSERYASNRARHWFLFMKRHASPLDKAGFLFLGGPYLLVVLMLREWRRGNLLPALRGLVRGARGSLQRPEKG